MRCVLLCTALAPSHSRTRPVPLARVGVGLALRALEVVVSVVVVVAVVVVWGLPHLIKCTIVFKAFTPQTISTSIYLIYLICILIPIPEN